MNWYTDPKRQRGVSCDSPHRPTRSWPDASLALRGQVPRGVVLAVLIIVLVIVAVLAVGLVQMIVTQHRLQAVHYRHLQTVELARGGVERGAAQLARSPDYEGETWTIPAEALGENDIAVVVIDVTQVDGSDDLRRVSSAATWGTGRDMLRHTDELVIDIGVLKAND